MPPAPPPYEPTQLERAFGYGYSVQTLEARIPCTLSVEDPTDHWTACLANGDLGFGALSDIQPSIFDAERRTKPGGCIIGVKAHSGGATICAALKAP